MDLQICEVVVIQASAFEVLIVEVETQRLDEMQGGTRDGGGAEPTIVEGLRGGLFIIEVALENLWPASQHLARLAVRLPFPDVEVRIGNPDNLDETQPDGGCRSWGCQ